MSALSHDIALLVKNQAAGDTDAFFQVALDAAHREQRQGRRNAAQEIRDAVDEAKTQAGQTSDDEQATDSDVDEFIRVTRPEGKLDELIVSAELIERVRHLLEEHKQADKLRDAGFTPAHRILMEGPAGTGKTATASIIAAELGIPMVTVWLDSLLNAHATTENAPSLSELFTHLARRRAVYLFDVFDSADVDEVGGHSIRGVFQAFLAFVSALGQGSVAIAATNRRAALDRSMFRHFDTVFSFSLPGDDEAMQVIRAELGSRAPEPVLNEADLYGQYLVGLSHAELTLAARSAAKAAVMRGDAQVTEDDLIHALTNRAGHILNSEGFEN